MACTEGTFFKDGRCEWCSLNCKSCTSYDSCSEEKTCESGFWKNGSACDSCPANCEKCDEEGNC